MLDSGKAMDRVVFQEIHSGEIFGFDSFLTGAPAYSSIVVDSEKAVVSAVQRASRLHQDRSKRQNLFFGRCVRCSTRVVFAPLRLCHRGCWFVVGIFCIGYGHQKGTEGSI